MTVAQKEALRDRLSEEIAAEKSQDVAAQLLESDAFWRAFWSQFWSMLFRTLKGAWSCGVWPAQWLQHPFQYCMREWSVSGKVFMA